MYDVQCSEMRVLLVGQDVYKRHREDPLSLWMSFDVPNPPLVVFFTSDNNHFSFYERELIIIISLTVINGLHSPYFVLPLK